MRPKIGDVFEVEGEAPTGPFHIYFQVTALPRGHVHGKALKIIKMNHNNYKVGDIVAWPRRSLFGELTQRWYDVTRLPKSKYPEYYL